MKLSPVSCHSYVACEGDTVGCVPGREYFTMVP